MRAAVVAIDRRGAFKLCADRVDKLRASARAGIAYYWMVNFYYWMVNFDDRRIETYRDPGPNGYGSSRTGDRISRTPFRIGDHDL